MKMFLAKKIFDIIEEVEVEKKLKKMVVINGKRNAIDSYTEIYCDTWEEAYQYLLNSHHKRINEAEVQLKYKKDALERFLHKDLNAD